MMAALEVLRIELEPGAVTTFAEYAKEVRESADTSEETPSKARENRLNILRMVRVAPPSYLTRLGKLGG
jgi:hypothetical protein